ncbi:MAG: hypothetical protein ABIR78_00365 [Ferruginibacter sp.]
MISSKPVFYLLPLFLCTILICKHQPVFSQKTKVYDLIKDFKAVPDDKTDNYLAFAKAAETISKAGGGQLNIPAGRYYIAAYKTAEKNKRYTAADIIFKNCINLTVIGNNAVIRLNGKFTRNRDYQAPGLPYYYAYNNTVCPFKLMNCKNVLLKDLTLYGEVDKMRKQNEVVEGESYGISISDESPTEISNNIVLQNITTHHFAADGILIRCSGENILINKCNSYKNARQGLSIVKGKNIRVLNSSFDSTGVTGSYGWHAPGAGIDVENEFGAGKLTNVLVRNCNLRGNNGFQIVTTLQSEKVIIDSCFISDGGYSEILTGVGMYSLNSTISNSIIFGNIQVDIADQQYTGPIVQEINKNIIYSGTRAIVSSDFSRPVNITDNILIMLPKPKMNDYFPYIQNLNCRFNRNIVVVHADRIKAEPNLVTALVQNAIEASEDFWLVNGYNIPVEKQTEVYFLPAATGTKIIKHHFFALSNVVSKYDYNKTNFLTNRQVRTILDNPIFTAYRQTSFNRKYLLQANEVRNYEASLVANAKKAK